MGGRVFMFERTVFFVFMAVFLTCFAFFAS